MSAAVSLPLLQAAPSRATLMIKPVGGVCNLRCDYCYYLPTLDLYGGHERRMSSDTLRAVFAGWLPQAADQIVIAWQGGEPTLAGLDFFREALRLQEEHRRPNQRILNTLQTNATLLDDEWCAFLHEHGFLVGVSIDGGKQMHDAYRVDAQGGPTFAAVRQGLKLLRRHRVEHNLLCVLTDRNVQHPRAVWQALVALDVPWLQFIPAIEWEAQDGGFRLASFAPPPRDYGRFLCEVFDLWFENSRDTISVRDFDAWVQALATGESSLCHYAPSCHQQLTLEHNGDVYGCDHYVEPQWRLGRIDPQAPGWLAGLDTQRFGAFAVMKSDLPASCRSCDYRHLCHGGCPKHRPNRGRVAEPSVLCESYLMFFEHAALRLEWLAAHVRAAGA